jgi:hypothetical protein
VLARLWRALGGPAEDAALEVADHGPVLSSALPVAELVAGAAGTALLAAAELAAARGLPRPVPSLDLDHLAVAAASERHVRLDGAVVGAAFDPTSAFFAADGGWVRTHGNYEHHRAALLHALGVADPGRLASAIAARTAEDVEQAVVAAGGCAAAVRSAGAWAAHPQGRLLAGADPTIGLVAREEGPSCAPPAPPPPGGLPCAGLRVLDLTRVIAGPVGTRMLAALGADVLRVDPPARPELPPLVLDGGLGKRRAAVDLASPAGAAWLERELVRADVVVDGFRPGALARRGLDPDALAERHPHVVHVSLSAWGEDGPWGARRGFDSLVQAATGVAVAVRPPGGSEPPGALPVQALDHATGHLLAAAALRALTGRAIAGRAGRARLALAATAEALLAAGPRAAAPEREVDAGPYLTTLEHPAGRLTVVRPPGALDGRALAWPSRLRPGGPRYS